jgi:hypothetical protein
MWKGNVREWMFGHDGSLYWQFYKSNVVLSRGLLLIDTPNYCLSCSKFNIIHIQLMLFSSRSQTPCDLRRGSVAARLLELWVRIPLETWMSVVSFVRCRVVCFGLITRRGESYRVWCVEWVWSWNLRIGHGSAFSRRAPVKINPVLNRLRVLRSCFVVTQTDTVGLAAVLMSFHKTV